MAKFFRIKLFFKFFISISIIVMATSGVISTFLISRQITDLKEGVSEMGLEFAEHLARDSEYGVLIGNKDIIMDNIKVAMREKDVIYAIVASSGGKVLAMDEGQIGIPIPSGIRPTFEAAAMGTTKPLAQSYQTDIAGEQIYEFSVPIKSIREERKREELSFPPEDGALSEKIGVARVGVSLARSNAAVQELIDLAHNLTLAVIGFGILAAALLVGIITTPLRALSAGMEKISRGELLPVNVSSNDEVGDLALSFNKMVADLIKYRRELEGYHKSLESKVTERTREVEEWRSYSENLISAMAEGLIAVDEDGVIKVVNKAIEDLTGFSEEELIGQRFIPALFPGTGREVAIDCFDHVKRAGILKQCDATLNTKDGVEIPVHFNGALLKSRGGGVQGMVIILHDMRKEKEAERMKTEFISTISHELRTPLTSIQGFVSLILNGKVGEISEKQKEFLNIVSIQGSHLGKLIKNLLEFSRFVGGKMAVEKTETAISDTIKEVVVAMKTQFDDKKIKLDVEVEPDLPRIHADPEKIGMVLSNILGNSLKFTPAEGEIMLKAKKDSGGILVAITDSGIGLAQENMEKIFERFFQVDSSFTRKVGGAGIGLSLAKEIVLAHEGKIWAESDGLGKGTSIKFTLPVG